MFHSPFVPRVLAAAFCLGASLAAMDPQDPAVAEQPTTTASAEKRGIHEARVRDVLGFLASDKMAGRDSPSPQLEVARRWLEEQFREAGLETVSEGAGWSHEYTLEGTVLDSLALAVTLHPAAGDAIVLTPDTEVRWWRGGRAMEVEKSEVLVGRVDTPLDPRLLRSGFGRMPVVLEVSGEDPLWATAGGRHGVLRGNRAGSQPVLLVRTGVLPAGEFTASIRLPAPTVEALPLANVMGVLRGASRPDEYVMVSSHYDHVGVQYGGGNDSIYNGADDNATGTTAVVCLAEALAQGPRPARSVLFVCFSAEEKGLRGSRAFAAEPPLDLAKVVAHANIEMIGRPEAGKERQAWITGAGYSDFAARAEPALERAGIALVEFAMAPRLFFASDNLPMAQAGVVAHSISAGSLHEDYHQPGDEVEKVDFAHMTAVIEGLHQVVLDLANSESTPQWNDEGRKALGGARRR